MIVNPTHYAVAIRYELDSMAAPRVLAKGKNYLALRIRQIAIDHQMPIVENQPLAQALYKSAEVGQEIPPHLYRAVAEVLAYIFKLMHRRGRKLDGRKRGADPAKPGRADRREAGTSTHRTPRKSTPGARSAPAALRT